MNGISKLRNLYLIDNRQRYPSLPEYARCFPRWSDRTANGLTKMVLDFLKLCGHQAERISCSGRYVDKSRIVTDVCGFKRRIGSGQWIKPSMQPGTADISATIYGKSVKIEIKIGLDRQSKAQIEYQRQVEAAGGTYVIASSFGQFYTWYYQNFKIE
jgi:hypothetical protein